MWGGRWVSPAWSHQVVPSCARVPQGAGSCVGRLSSKGAGCVGGGGGSAGSTTSEEDPGETLPSRGPLLTVAPAPPPPCQQKAVWCGRLDSGLLSRYQGWLAGQGPGQQTERAEASGLESRDPESVPLQPSGGPQGRGLGSGPWLSPGPASLASRTSAVPGHPGPSSGSALQMLASCLCTPPCCSSSSLPVLSLELVSAGGAEPFEKEVKQGMEGVSSGRDELHLFLKRGQCKLNTDAVSAIPCVLSPSSMEGGSGCLLQPGSSWR